MSRPDEAYDHLVSHGNFGELVLWDYVFVPEEIDLLLLKHQQRPLFPKLKHFGAFLGYGPSVDAMFAIFLPWTISSIYLNVKNLRDKYFQTVSRYTSLQSVTIVGM
jgi:hypothetical protein